MADSPLAEAELERAGLRLAVDDAVATITLARPERRNALTFSTWRTLARIGETLPAGVRVVVVRGEGPSFSAGIDLRLFSPEGVPGEFVGGEGHQAFLLGQGRAEADGGDAHRQGGPGQAGAQREQQVRGGEQCQQRDGQARAQGGFDAVASAYAMTMSAVAEQIAGAVAALQAGK